jgi:hypothetical protein
VVIVAEYLILIYSDEKSDSAHSEAEFAEVMAGHNAFAERNGPALRGGNALTSTDAATSIRADGVTDGPFMESKEALGGYYLIEAIDLDAALAVAKQVPFSAGGGLEVRPIRPM